MGDLLKLIGIVIIVFGFIVKADTLLVVIIAGIVTGLVSGMNMMEVLNYLGTGFVNNRVASIFIISFPVIAIIERYGLKERSAYMIGKLSTATSGAVLSLYMVIRTAAAAFSVRIGGHVQFIRPLILPMTQAAAMKENGGKPLTEKQDEEIKGMAAAVENYGNFFGQNVFAGASGVILVVETLKSAGYDVTLNQVAAAAIPVALIAVVAAVVQFNLKGRKIAKEGRNG